MHGESLAFFLFPLSLSASWVSSEVWAQTWMTNQWNSSRLRCIVLHPVDRVKTWRAFFIITLQSPWRHCSCNCAAHLAPGLVGFSQTPVAFQLGKEKYFHFGHTGNYLRVKLRCFLTDINPFFLTYDLNQRGYHSTEQFKWCVLVMYSIQVYSTLSFWLQIINKSVEKKERFGRIAGCSLNNNLICLTGTKTLEICTSCAHDFLHLSKLHFAMFFSLPFS